MREHKALLATMRQARRDFFGCQTMIATEVAFFDMIDDDMTDRELGAAGKALLIEAERLERAAARFKARVRYLLCQDEVDPTCGPPEPVTVGDGGVVVTAAGH